MLLASNSSTAQAMVVHEKTPTVDAHGISGLLDVLCWRIQVLPRVSLPR